MKKILIMLAFTSFIYPARLLAADSLIISKVEVGGNTVRKVDKINETSDSTPEPVYKSVSPCDDTPCVSPVYKSNVESKTLPVYESTVETEKVPVYKSEVRSEVIPVYKSEMTQTSPKSETSDTLPSTGPDYLVAFGLTVIISLIFLLFKKKTPGYGSSRSGF